MEKNDLFNIGILVSIVFTTGILMAIYQEIQQPIPQQNRVENGDETGAVSQ